MRPFHERTAQLKLALDEQSEVRCLGLSGVGVIFLCGTEPVVFSKDEALILAQSARLLAELIEEDGELSAARSLSVQIEHLLETEG